MCEVESADIVFGLTWGDEGKGKIIAQLAKSGNYDWVCRWNGGSNAGHTIYIDGEKFHTHIIPSGVFYGVKSLIGPDCYLNIDDFKTELNYLKHNGFDTSLIKVSPMTHVITDEQKAEDANNPRSTGKGIGPCARDKYARTGKRFAEMCPDELQSHLWNPEKLPLSGNILCEGAQGFWLDINYGNYPYVTSSATLPYSACSLGFSPNKIRTIYGAAKAYDTRVGYDPEFENLWQPDSNDLEQIARVGKEFGVTTGRARKVTWLNYNKLRDAINISGTNVVIISKVDILEEVNKYVIKKDDLFINYTTIEEFKTNIGNMIFEDCKLVKTVFFSDHPEFIDGLI
jgi:adenylosuccinate synthase